MDSQQRNFPNEEISTLKDALLGLTALNQDTFVLDYGPVLIRRNYEQLSTVRLLSGGIAGPDLSYATFVGKGMLTGAVIGDEIAPSSRLIMRTIKELYQGENCGIFVITRVGSEMFNFNLAVQRVSTDCQMRAKLLCIDDNKAEKYSTCGFIILIKILGAMAEEGVFFDDMWKCYKEIAEYIISVPLSFQHFAQLNRRSRVSVSLSGEFDRDFRNVIGKKSQSKLHLHPSIPVVALINTSKSLEKSAELGLVKQVVERLRYLGVCIARIYLGNFIAVPHKSASLSILNVFDNNLIKYMDAPCEAIGWQRSTQFLPEVTVVNELPGLLTNHGKEQVPLQGPKLTFTEVNILVRSVQFACEALISCERQLNIIDAEKSDANIGTRLKKFAEHLNKKLQEQKVSPECPYTFFKKLSVMVESAVGGTLGAIYGVIFDRTAEVFGEIPENETITADTWTNALTAVEEVMRQCAGDDKRMTTMYFPIRVCQMTVKDLEKFDVLERFGLGVSQAEEAAQKTKLPGHKYPDAGAHAVGIWMRAVYEGVKLLYLGEITATEID